MKNGKASGIDGIRSELMKYIIKDEQIKNIQQNAIITYYKKR